MLLIKLFRCKILKRDDTFNKKTNNRITKVTILKALRPFNCVKVNSICYIKQLRKTDGLTKNGKV